MPTIRVQLDPATFRALIHAAGVAQFRPAEFIRQAVKEAIRTHEFACMKQAYLKQPDSGADANHWSNCEEFKL